MKIIKGRGILSILLLGVRLFSGCPGIGQRKSMEEEQREIITDITPSVFRQILREAKLKASHYSRGFFRC